MGASAASMARGSSTLRSMSTMGPAMVMEAITPVQATTRPIFLRASRISSAK